VCSSHGARAPQVKAAAERRVAERKAREAVAKLGKVAPGSVDPLDVLDETLAELVALKERLGVLVATLGDESLRYEGRAGKQIRGEIQAYMASLRDVVKTSETIVKLGLDERRVRVSEVQILRMAEAIRNVLTDLELTERQRQLAAISLPRRLRELEGAQAQESESADRETHMSARRSPVLR
jgi:hypothetical protein